MALTDARWAVLEPLVELCRQHAKVPPRHLRRTIGVILWRHDNGAKLSPDFGEQAAGDIWDPSICRHRPLRKSFSSFAV
jgi:hypothetical protein